MVDVEVVVMVCLGTREEQAEVIVGAGQVERAVGAGLGLGRLAGSASAVWGARLLTGRREPLELIMVSQEGMEREGGASRVLTWVRGQLRSTR
jgi:hypothetical protein